MHNEYINKYIEETKEIIGNVDRESVGKFIDILFDTWKNGKKIITVGNGGSASTAAHFAGDLLKTVANTSSDKDVRDVKGFKAICLNDNHPSIYFRIAHPFRCFLFCLPM